MVLPFKHILFVPFKHILFGGRGKIIGWDGGGEAPIIRYGIRVFL